MVGIPQFFVSINRQTYLIHCDEVNQRALDGRVVMNDND